MQYDLKFNENIKIIYDSDLNSYIINGRNFESLYQARASAHLYNNHFQVKVDLPAYNFLNELNLDSDKMIFFVDPISKCLVVRGLSNKDANISDVVIIDLERRKTSKLILPNNVCTKENVWETIDCNSTNVRHNFSVELFSDIYYSTEHQAVIGSYYYNYEWIQERVYDIFTKTWKEIIRAYRA